LSNWVALLRGVNVGGHNKIAMAELRKVLAEDGFSAPKSYIQSGNLVVGARCDPTSRISTLIQEHFEIDVPVMAFEPAEFASIANDIPFTGDPSRILAYLSATQLPELDQSDFDALAANGEEITIRPKAIFLNAPDGISRSKLAAKIEKIAGIPLTARNQRTVDKLVELSLG